MTLSESSRVNYIFGPVVRGQHKEVPLTSNPTAGNIELAMGEAWLIEMEACHLEGLT